CARTYEVYSGSSTFGYW
nr:immunoglobulin heavy chain junction region [Macaca mulatta]MPN73170.1 immunoglobulin heavy chain junction region [Macaca mulatta]MPN73570.1 immunoglobulin heavy chain junction region [Macaca mulatta]MPN73647.1 immunoglobulin heavy chain junction region [Macaca mulatta]MPN73828.1 immunoglobulin heavy chain junction region [Macaca mulatta]